MLDLQPAEALVHIPDKSEVLPKCQHFRINRKQFIKIPVQDFKAIEQGRIGVNHRFHFLYMQRAFWPFVVEMSIV